MSSEPSAVSTTSTPASSAAEKVLDVNDAPPTAPVETEPDNNSKLRTFLGILRKFIGVSDLANIRFSLPAHLLEPTPNLEYWTYLDRPEAFASIGDSEDPVGRMLGAIRFWFTKDLKYIKGKPCKPYNSTLGEFFRCNWEVEDTLPELKHPNSEPASSSVSFTSAKSSAVAAAALAVDGVAGDGSGERKKIKISFLTEQTSHHPPVSAFVIECAEKGITARGYDQIAAKFTGTSVRISAGNHNYGIFINLNKWGEEYQLTHPIAHIGGLLRGKFGVAAAYLALADE
jgi:oxysterol-binding protein-related protein 9/10/11